MTTWRKELMRAISETKDDLKSLVCTLSESELDVEFDNGYGGAKGKPFTAWTTNYVYFPVVYDGAEWVGFAPRNPCDIATAHMGSE